MTRLEAAARRLQQSVARLETAVETRDREDTSPYGADTTSRGVVEEIDARLESLIDRLRRVLET
jgi:hypothetical protein